VPVEPVTLTFWAFTHDGYNAALQTQIDEFVAANPNITVNFETFPFADYFQAITVAAAGNDLPDVMMVDQPWSSILAEQGLATPLDSFISADSLADIVPYGVQGATYEGQMWSLPYEETAAAIWYNVAAFEAAGVPLPSDSADDPWTYSEFMETAQALTQDTDGDGQIDKFAFTDCFLGHSEVNTVAPFVWSLGGEFVSPDGTTTEGYVNSPAAVEAFEDYLGLFEVSPSQPLPNIVEAFATGQVAMLACISRFHSVIDGLDVDYGVTTLPFPSAGQPAALCGAWNLAMSSTTENPDAAWALLDALTNEAGAERAFQLYPGLPARQSVLDNHPELFEYPLSIFTDVNVNYCHPRPQTPVWPTIHAEVQTALNDLKTGGDVQGRLDELAVTLDAALESYK
jgi:ABC-type glycerol-3-phosphate transport system substrate-binding protein